MSKEDRERMLDFLRTYGPLDDAGKYAGSDRAGYSQTAGAGDQTGVLSQPIDMHTLLDENFWQGMLFDEQFDMQATMFQPVGGMDRIPYAFAKALGDVVKYNAPVTGDSQDRQGRQGRLHQPWISEIDRGRLLHLRHAAHHFEEDAQRLQRALQEGDRRVHLRQRLQDRLGEPPILGAGLQHLRRPGIRQRGLQPHLVSFRRHVYPARRAGERIHRRSDAPHQRSPLAQKFEESRKSIERLHPGHGKELEKPMYVTWGQIPDNEGSWIRTYGPGQERWSSFSQTAPHTNPGYETLIEPDGPIIFAGDHVSHIVAWQEGAALSALRAVGQINDKAKAAKLAKG